MTWIWALFRRKPDTLFQRVLKVHIRSATPWGF